MPEDVDNFPPTALENGSWLWDWNKYKVQFPNESRDFDVATIEYWKYDNDEQRPVIPPIRKFQIRDFHTQMDSWLNEPVPVVDGQHPSSGFKIVALPCHDTDVVPPLTREELQSLNATLGLPFFEGHYASTGIGASGAFLQSDGSYGSSQWNMVENWNALIADCSQPSSFERPHTPPPSVRLCGMILKRT